MRFEARELKPYAEPVSANALKEGSAYFQLQYYDNEMLMPCLETIIFIGQDLSEDGTRTLIFQDVDSYKRGVSLESSSEDEHATFQGYSKNELNAIFEFEHALDRLLECSLRRRRVIDE